MATNTTTLVYHRHTLEALSMGGQMWISVPQIVGPMGFASSSGVDMLFARNRDEFTSDETRLVSLPTAAGMRETRVFSLRGARLLALLARTPEAKAFRRWVLDLLEGRVRRAVPSLGAAGLPGTYPLPKDAIQALDAAAAFLEEGHPALAMIRDLRDGTRPLPGDPAMDRLVALLDGARHSSGDANRAWRHVREEARRCGYTLESVKSAARERSRFPAQPALGFDAAAPSEAPAHGA